MIGGRVRIATVTGYIQRNLSVWHEWDAPGMLVERSEAERAGLL